MKPEDIKISRVKRWLKKAKELHLVLEVDINEPLKPEDRVSVYLTTQVRSEIRIPLLIEKLTMKEFSLLKTKLEDVRQRKGFNHTEALDPYKDEGDVKVGCIDFECGVGHVFNADGNDHGVAYTEEDVA